jgi:imidazolonepropionase-like amidohydrolase
MQAAALGWLWIALTCGATAATPADLVIFGDTIHTMAGDPITNGAVVVQDGQITAIGSRDQLELPEAKDTLRAQVVTPGLVDAHSVIGLAGILNQSHDQEQLEESEPMQPELRAFDAYNARDPLIQWVRELGVTTLHTGHAPGALISGQTMIVKTDAQTVNDAVLRPLAMVVACLGEAALEDGGDSPGTRAKAVAMLRTQFLKAQTYREKRSREDPEKHPERDLRLDILSRVLSGEIPFLVTAHRHHDILAALRLADEFNLNLVLDGASEAYLVLDKIKEAGVPVILHPTMYRARGEQENLSMATAAKLSDAGIPFALQSGYESYVPKTRVVLFEAAIAAAYGLPFEKALSAVTIDAARILGIDDRVGSLEPGKDADLALFDGDPFEYTTHCVGVVIEGKVAGREAR